MNKNTAWALFFLIFFQLITSTSNICLANLVTSVTEGSDLILYYFGLFIASLFVGTIPEAGSAYFLNKAKLSAVKNYTKKLVETHRNIPVVTFDSKIRGEQEPWLTGEGEKTINESIDIIHRSFSMSLFSIFNVGTLCFVLDPSLLLGYSISLISMPIASRLFNTKIKALSLQSQKDRKALNQILLSAWDNITIGNQYNFSHWWKKFFTNIRNTETSGGKLIMFSSLANSISLIAILSPVVSNVGWIVKKNRQSPAKLTTLVATFSKQVDILFSLHNLFTTRVLWNTVYYPKLCALKESIDTPIVERTDIYQRIHWSKIKILQENYVHDDITSMNQFLVLIRLMNKGRITIRGDNGTGKSTLLCLLKQNLNEKAFYLPNHSQLEFQNPTKNGYSSGQKMRTNLDELILLASSNNNRMIILIDEWNANLDKQSVQEFSSKIDEIAKNTVVVEVTHQVENTHQPILQDSKIHSDEAEISTIKKSSINSVDITNDKTLIFRKVQTNRQKDAKSSGNIKKSRNSSPILNTKKYKSSSSKN